MRIIKISYKIQFTFLNKYNCTILIYIFKITLNFLYINLTKRGKSNNFLYLRNINPHDEKKEFLNLYIA